VFKCFGRQKALTVHMNHGDYNPNHQQNLQGSHLQATLSRFGDTRLMQSGSLSEQHEIHAREEGRKDVTSQNEVRSPTSARLRTFGDQMLNSHLLNPYYYTSFFFMHHTSKHTLPAASSCARE
jgi:hypothetical protein